MKKQSPNYRSILRSLAYLNKYSKGEVSIVWVNDRNCKIIYGNQCIYPVSVPDAHLLDSLVADRLNTIANKVAKIKFAAWMSRNAN